MSIDLMYDTSATSQRETFVTGSTIKKTYTSYLPTFRCCVQPFDATIASDITGSFGKQWLLFCDVLDIVENDRITIGTTVYRVMAVESFLMGWNPHMEIQIKTF